MATSQEGMRDFTRLVVGFFLPPLAVFLQVGLGAHFWLNLVLTVLLLGIGGQIHAAYVITTVNDDGTRADGGMGKFVASMLGYYLPPVGVFLRLGIGGALILNALLWVFGWFPGVIHALWLINKDD